MKRYILLATTAMLAACTQPPVINSASVQPAAAANNQEAEDNQELAAFFENYDQQELAASPMTKAYRGIRDGDYGKWNDPSETASVADFERQQRSMEDMEDRFDAASLNANDALSYRLFKADAALEKAAFPFRNNRYIFDQMNGAQSQIPAFLINIHRVATKSDAEAYISRIEASGPYLYELVKQSGERANNGVIVPSWVFPYVIADAQNVIKGAPFDNGADSPIYNDLKTKVNKLDIPVAEKNALINSGANALKNNLKPAYQKIIAEMQRQQKMSSQGDGIWRFKDGADYYKERLANYTNTNLTPDQVHQIGLDNVTRIHGQMRKIMADVGFKGDLNAFFEYLRNGDEFFYDSREAYLADVDSKLAAMKAKLPEFFNTLPEAPLEIKAVEAFREKSAGKAFYQSPAPDGSRPGTYYVNLYNLKDMSKTELEALAYHEGLPGHHLQRAIQTELGDLPPFRRFGGWTAYTEGWGLYTEELGKDMGFYQDPYSDFGRLGMELWRAARLVVDTGLHDKRWSREKAIKYLKDNTPNPDGDIEKAIERYIVYPGQANAYMIGKLKIMELRDRAKQQLGDKFTYAGFHDVVLRSGPVPLDMLEEQVNLWVAANK